MSSGFSFERVGIVGLGLIGGSLARALRRLDNAPRVVAFNRSRDAAEQALADGVIDAVADTAGKAAEGQDLVVYATPLDVALEMMRAHSGEWGDATVHRCGGPQGAAVEGSGRTRFRRAIRRESSHGRWDCHGIRGLDGGSLLG